MKTTHVEITYGETRSVNFQSCTVHCTLRAELDEGEDEKAARESLEWQCLRAVNEAFDRHDERVLCRLSAQEPQ